MSNQIAAQMFTVREFTKTAVDFAASLKKISDIGYPAVQLSAVGAMNGDTPEVDAALAGRMLADHGLKCIATHRPWGQLRDTTEKEIEFHNLVGCDFAAIGGIHGGYENSLAGYRQFVQDAIPVIEKLKAAGIRFGHHNHSSEFWKPAGQDKTLEDILIDEAPADLMLELDLYWIEHAGLNCVNILKRVAGRVPVIHIKDKEVVAGKNETRMAPIGEGNLEWDRILPACRAAGVRWYAVEQDQCFRDPFDCLKSSFDFLRSKGV
jgi:sugar phosphate isomerase/epimerase